MIRIVSTGEEYPSAVDRKVGQKLWKGYEYDGHMQYLAANPQLCEGTNEGLFSCFDVTSAVDKVSPRFGGPFLTLAFLAFVESCDSYPHARRVQSDSSF